MTPGTMAHAPVNRSLMVVDDEADVRHVICGSFSKRGFRCGCAASGPEALQKLAESPADLVLTDLRMPGMTGLELLEQLSLHHPTSFVILLTAHADVPTVVQAMRGGASDFLTKPFSLRDLHTRVEAALDKRQALVEELEARQSNERRLEGLLCRYEQLRKGAIQSLTSILDFAHPATYAHSERVALRSAAVANAMGVIEEEVRAIYLAGLLHDLGKVTISRHVLDKATRLSATERIAIRTHAERSAHIASSVELPESTVDAIRHHHERYDGTGYPAGLKGDAIPFGARVVAVCDAYDAMSCERPYRPALPESESVRQLWHGSGTQFDPSVISSFCVLRESNQLD